MVTHLAFQHDGALTTLSTNVVSVALADELDEADKPLFKTSASSLGANHVVVTEDTIFHPQGGGQPSDTGIIKRSTATFVVTAARTSIAKPGTVLHMGHFEKPQNVFTAGEAVEQSVDAERRLLYSRYHTAGHVLGSAVRHLLEKEVDGFDELKASHFPDSASCEFQGLISGTHKESIQKRLDDYIAADMPVEIDWWDEDDFRKAGLERLLPDRKLLNPGETKFRVVKIVGAEVYPCGGTHVNSTAKCGKTTVRKITRQKGFSKVSYAL